jgi:hypothetical protein
MQVRVSYGAGRLDVRPGAASTLYDVRLSYDAASGSPLYAYSPETRSLRVGTSRVSARLSGVRTHSDDSLRVALTRAAPIDLSIELGAVEANIDLSGLRVDRLSLTSGASEATVRFDSANATPMRQLELQAGVAKLHALGLANANAEEVRVNAGVGSVELDFSGEMRSNMDLSLDVALGTVVLRVPAGVGLRMELTKTLTNVTAPGLHHDDGVWTSDNWATATHRLQIHARTTLGRLTIERP